MPQIEIFRSGRHTATSGKTIAFSEGDVAASAAAYDPALSEAPLVVGHPRLDGPAYGWVKGLSVADGKLVAETDQVDAAFAAIVNQGRYKKISAAFFAPDAPNNPKPGVYYLRHVGFLGATPPAVSGLKSVAFAAEEDGVVAFASTKWGWSTVAALFRGLRDAMIADRGQDAADKALPGYSIDFLNEVADDQADDAGSVSPGFAAPATPTSATPASEDAVTEKEKELAQREARLKADETALETQRTEFAQRAAAQTKLENEGFVEILVKGGKVLPAEKAALLAFMATLDAATVVEFADAGGTVKKPQLDAFKAQLEARPKRVEFKEIAGAGTDGQEVNFADPLSISNAAAVFETEMAKKGVKVTSAQAVKHVMKGATR